MFKRWILLVSALFCLRGCAAPPEMRPDPIVRPPVLGSPARPMPRVMWAGAGPNLSDIRPMTKIHRLTVHHDGLLDLFFSSDLKSTASRLESIRQMHRNKGWSDIGYHHVLDRAGRLWEARPVQYQGAHAKDHNDGNIGILVLGNFQEHQPDPKQLRALRNVIVHFQKIHGIPISGVYTHGELGVTTCPGKYLQSHVDRIRQELGR